jgi:hypothetical protein
MARVILDDLPLECQAQLKILHSVKVLPAGPIDMDSYERALRETLTYHGQFVELPAEETLCETLPNCPDLSSLSR